MYNIRNQTSLLGLYNMRARTQPYQLKALRRMPILPIAELLKWWEPQPTIHEIEVPDVTRSNISWMGLFFGLRELVQPTVQVRLALGKILKGRFKNNGKEIYLWMNWACHWRKFKELAWTMAYRPIKQHYSHVIASRQELKELACTWPTAQAARPEDYA